MTPHSAAPGQLAIFGEGDRVTARTRDGTCFVNVHSARGIGGARLALRGGPMLAAVVLRLHLSGLEQLTLDFGDLIVSISVASDGAGAIKQSMARQAAGAASAFSPLGPSDPEWSDVVRRPCRGADPAARRFDVWLAEALCAREPFVCAIQWVDFYR
jgi:hypothetical protein